MNSYFFLFSRDNRDKITSHNESNMKYKQISFGICGGGITGTYFCLIANLLLMDFLSP